MNKAELMEKLKNLSMESGFENAAAALTDPDEVLAFLKEKGIEATKEELSEVAASFLPSEEGEIGEDALETVSGGISLPLVIRLLSPFTKPIPLQPVNPKRFRK